ncbi:hypothetical protein OOZ19_09620 [Saccharopolyspora sp. NFXS83]|uniref:hypothetical protein n=1 Tax=Saccharopolyspora sp. NFXS83 TaxID=2993560 RepID=UPI00224A67E4|nr:hypothetical protein [Saccharopolyspora sp. NFXS83]MCX2730500.1 hypothetical protein [Saccharopolyspora sp. NFXS83]
MKSRIAAAVALGYFLGRTKKMKLAIVVGGVLAGKKLPTDPAELLRQGVKSVAGSDELSSLTRDVRGQLVEAAKAAATAAASRKIESLGDSLSERAAGLRDGAGEASPTRNAGAPEADAPEAPEADAPEAPEAEQAPEAGSEAEQAPEAERPRARARQGTRGTRPARPEHAGRGGRSASDRPAPRRGADRPSRGEGDA